MPVVDLDAPARATQLTVDEALSAVGEFGRGPAQQLLLVRTRCSDRVGGCSECRQPRKFAPAPPPAPPPRDRRSAPRGAWARCRRWRPWCSAPWPHCRRPSASSPMTPRASRPWRAGTCASCRATCGGGAPGEWRLQQRVDAIDMQVHAYHPLAPLLFAATPPCIPHRHPAGRPRSLAILTWCAAGPGWCPSRPPPFCWPCWPAAWAGS